MTKHRDQFIASAADDAPLPSGRRAVARVTGIEPHWHSLTDHEAVVLLDLHRIEREGGAGQYDAWRVIARRHNGRRRRK